MANRLSLLTVVFFVTAATAIMIGPHPPSLSKLQSGISPVVGAEPFLATVQTQPPFLFGVNPDGRFDVETEPPHATVSSDLTIEPPLPELNLDGRFIDVETEPPHATVSSVKVQPLPSSPTGVNSGHTPPESIGNRRMLKVTSPPTKESCIKCCTSETPTTRITIWVGRVMLGYIAVGALCFGIMIVMSFQDAPRYQIIKDGDLERVQLKREEMGPLFCGALPRARDSGRPATVLDVHVDEVKQWLRELSSNEKLRRFTNAVEQTSTVLKAAGFPLIFVYIVIRVTWPALVVIGVAHPWPGDLESINRVRP